MFYTYFSTLSTTPTNTITKYIDIIYNQKADKKEGIKNENYL